MGRNTWIAGLVMCAGLAGLDIAAAQTSSRPVVHVQIIDRAQVPEDTLERARTEAARVFELSGVTLAWVDATGCQNSCLTVRIVTQAVSAKSSNPRVLGVAPGTKETRGINLWIFYPRVSAYSADLGMDASQLLGYVIAHEMGHLLLPYGAHAAAGVMRAEWDRAQVRSAVNGLLMFTPDQAALIHERLRASASAVASLQPSLIPNP
jgi:hypothetical protein